MSEDAKNKAILLQWRSHGPKQWYLPATGTIVASECEPCNLENESTNLWDHPTDRPITRLAFALTMRCNLHCSFCYNHNNEAVTGLDQRSIKTAIDELAVQVRAGVPIGLIFSGGEPLLRRADLIAAIDYASGLFARQGNPLSITLYTNATLVDRDLVETIRLNHIQVMISLDGPEAMHNRNRIDKRGRNAFQQTVQAIDMLRDAGLVDQLQIRSVINSSGTSMADIMDLVLSIGIRRMHLMPAYGNGKRLIGKDALANWLECLTIYELLLRNGVVIEVSPFWRIFRKLAHPGRFADAYLPCTAGREMLGVGADGQYYLCHHYSGSKQPLGRIGNGLPEPHHYRTLSPIVAKREPCGSCPVRHLCGGPCYHREYIGAGPAAVDDCREYISLLVEAAKSYARLAEMVPEVMSLVAKNRVHIPDGVGARLACLRETSRPVSS
jgi:uncharacterized protein